MGELRRRKFKVIVRIPRLLNDKAGFEPRQSDWEAHILPLSRQRNKPHMPAWYSGDWSLGDTVLMMLPYTFQSVTSPKCTYGILKFYYALHVFKFATKSLRMHWTVSLWESPGTAILVLITCSVATSENLMKSLLTSNNITCKWKIQPMAQDQSWAIGEEQSWTSEKLIIFNTNKRAW